MLYACTDAFYRPQQHGAGRGGQRDHGRGAGGLRARGLPVQGAARCERIASPRSRSRSAEPVPRVFHGRWQSPCWALALKSAAGAGDALKIGGHLRHAHGAYLRRHDAAVPQALRRGAGEPGLLRARYSALDGGAVVPVRRRDAGAGDGARPAAGRDRPSAAPRAWTRNCSRCAKTSFTASWCRTWRASRTRPARWHRQFLAGLNARRRDRDAGHPLRFRT